MKKAKIEKLCALFAAQLPDWDVCLVESYLPHIEATYKHFTSLVTFYPYNGVECEISVTLDSDVNTIAMHVTPEELLTRWLTLGNEVAKIVALLEQIEADETAEESKQPYA